MFSFPQTTEYGKRIPKQKLYENLDISPSLRRVFVNQIRLIYWRNKLAASIYFVAETKGSMSSMQLRLIEESKIHCAREHFKAISSGNVVYDVVDSYQTLLERVMK